MYQLASAQVVLLIMHIMQGPASSASVQQHLPPDLQQEPDLRDEDLGSFLNKMSGAIAMFAVEYCTRPVVCCDGLMMRARVTGAHTHTQIYCKPRFKYD
jgi:hypothetical protein